MASISKEEMDRILVRDSKNFDKQINEFSPIKSASN